TRATDMIPTLRHRLPTSLCFLFQLLTISLYALLFSRFSWDRKQYCRLGELAIGPGSSPYRVDDVIAATQSNLFLTYPPFILPIFEFLCAQPWWLWCLVYLSLYLLLVWVSEVACEPTNHLILALGFLGIPTIFASGNIELIEVMLFVAALCCSQKKLQFLAGTFLGAAIVIKLQCALFLPLLCLAARDRMSIVRFLGGVLAIASLGYLVSFWIFPNLSLEYFQMIYAEILLGRSNVVMDPYQPSLVNFIAAMWPGDHQNLFPLICIIPLYGSALLLAYRSRNQESTFHLAVLIALICFPRLAYYSYALVLWSLCKLCNLFSASERALICSISLLPSIFALTIFKSILIPGPVIFLSYTVVVLLCFRFQMRLPKS
ncbi:MAG: DUF2029 domain-containing protein, partial [Deltaproteobacteria bacterium]|nr:DUF2029 domain-containing protein [Deltaproteobacteria bacterium]